MSEFDWLVIGAGPAGIGAVGKLLDHQIPAEKIGWLDPLHQVGDLGTKWMNVPSNTRVELFLRFLNGCKSFDYPQRKQPFPLDQLHPMENCHLREVAAPLQWVTDHLLKKVQGIKGEALSLNLLHGRWEVKTKESKIFARNVILAIGAEPKLLQYPSKTSIPLEVALNPEKLEHQIHAQDVVGVFGSSHSAVLILANLLRLPVKTVYNFYRSPHLYAVHLGDWILFDDMGLKGFAAEWARHNLDGTPPPNLKRVLLSDRTFEECLAVCNKVVYAVGFDKRQWPVVEQYPHAKYNDTTGIIAPGLFGLGVAFPQAMFDRLGNRTYRVGLWKFMDYLNNIVPIWLKTANRT